MEALFEAPTFLATLRGAVLERSSVLERNLERVARYIRKFCGLRRMISQTPRSKHAFVQLFNRDLRAIMEMDFMMKDYVDTFLGPYGVRKLPQPRFEETMKFFDAAPVHWMCMPVPGGAGNTRRRDNERT